MATHSVEPLENSAVAVIRYLLATEPTPEKVPSVPVIIYYQLENERIASQVLPDGEVEVYATVQVNKSTSLAAARKLSQPYPVEERPFFALRTPNVPLSEVIEVNGSVTTVVGVAAKASKLAATSNSENLVRVIYQVTIENAPVTTVEKTIGDSEIIVGKDIGLGNNFASVNQVEITEKGEKHEKRYFVNYNTSSIQFREINGSLPPYPIPGIPDLYENSPVALASDPMYDILSVYYLNTESVIYVTRRVRNPIPCPPNVDDERNIPFHIWTEPEKVPSSGKPPILKGSNLAAVGILPGITAVIYQSSVDNKFVRIDDVYNPPNKA
ncbi:hypothetical protein BDZ91DRAFT_845284 [Kalaharituber pfeilii]|nr:hypothetical protein BDZ91DRAFT_845284 [Kalaharituber pfeilii]